MGLDKEKEALSYSFYELLETNKIHVFKGEITNGNGCTIENLSVCNKAHRVSRNSSIVKLCLKIDKAKKEVKLHSASMCEDCLGYIGNV